MLRLIVIVLIFFLVVQCAYTQGIDIMVSKSEVSFERNDDGFYIEDQDGEIIIDDLDTVIYIIQRKLLLLQKNNNWGMISKFGNILLPIEYDKIIQMTDSYTYWEVLNDGKRGIYNTDIGLVIPVEFDEINLTRKKGFEFVVTNNGKSGIFNKFGIKVVSLEYDVIKKQYDAIVLQKDNKYSYFIGNKIFTDSIILNRSFKIHACGNKELIDSYYVFCLNGKQGVINSNREVVVKPDYQFVIYPWNITYDTFIPVVLVKLNGLAGVVDMLGNQVVEPRYQDVFLIDSENAVVKLDSKMYFLNYRTNTIYDKYYFDRFHVYTEGYVTVHKDGMISIVDIKNNFKLQFPFEYQNVLKYGEYYIVEKESKYGVIDVNNKEVIPCKYESLRFFCDKVLVIRDGMFGVLSINNEILIQIENFKIIRNSNNIVVYRNEDSVGITYDCDLNCIKNCPE